MWLVMKKSILVSANLSPTQMMLFTETLVDTNESDLSSHDKVYAQAFRKLYYHLYTNSNASRAERIISDLSNLLLCKIAGERNGEGVSIYEFLKGRGTANDLL